MSTDKRVPKIYTRTGDKGKTSLIGGSRVSKSDLRLEAYGTVDELNSVIGVMIRDINMELAALPDASATSLKSEASELTRSLMDTQSDLFNVGSQLACEDPAFRSQLPGVDEEKIADLEAKMDAFTENLAPLKHFILPGGSRAAGMAHIARTVCRRAERICVALAETESAEEDAAPATVDPVVLRYLNRLSDYLFVLARHLNRLMNIEEPIWSGKSAKAKSAETKAAGKQTE